MIEDKMVSVIIPVFNVSDYLEKCVLSVIKQTYKNIEIILVDDGSTDHTSEELIQAYDLRQVTSIEKKIIE